MHVNVSLGSNVTWLATLEANISNGGLLRFWRNIGLDRIRSILHLLSLHLLLHKHLLELELRIHHCHAQHWVESRWHSHCRCAKSLWRSCLLLRCHICRLAPALQREQLRIFIIGALEYLWTYSALWFCCPDHWSEPCSNMAWIFSSSVLESWSAMTKPGKKACWDLRSEFQFLAPVVSNNQKSMKTNDTQK